MLALLRAVGARPFQNETFAAAEWRENLLGRHGQSRDGCERLAKQNTIYLEFLNVTHRRLISAFRPPAPDMDSTRTEARSPKGARASASHGSSAQTPARSETSARLLLAARDIPQVVLNRGGAFLLKEQRRAQQARLQRCRRCPRTGLRRTTRTRWSDTGKGCRLRRMLGA